jgi:hypothetical protein
MIARIFRSTFTTRRSFLVLGTVVVGLAFPAASMGTTDQIKTTPIHKGSQGFQLTLAIHQGVPTGYGGRYPNSVAVILFRHTHNGTENDNYAFSTPKPAGTHKINFSGSKDLSSAQIAGSFVNSGGSINMTFHATGKPSHVNVPKGCTGHGGTKRSGTLSGSFTVHADNLGTITQNSFKATISTAAFQCYKASRGYELQTSGYNPAWVDIFKTSASSPVSEEIDVSNTGNGWAFDHKFTASRAPTSDYKLNTSKLNSATVKGADGITGKATYSSKKSSKHDTVGKMSGSLAVTFGTIGKVKAFPSSRGAKQNHS